MEWHVPNLFAHVSQAKRKTGGFGPANAGHYRFITTAAGLAPKKLLVGRAKLVRPRVSDVVRRDCIAWAAKAGHY